VLDIGYSKKNSSYSYSAKNSNKTMNQSQPKPDPIALPPRMRAALERYQKRVWVIKLAEGFLAAIFGWAVSYLLVFGLDRLFDTPAVLRAVILAVGSAGMVILFPLKVHNWIWRHRRLDQAARLVRHRFPRFGDHLLGIVELAQSESQPGKSRALVAAAIRQVDAELASRDLSDAVPHARHRHWAWAAGVPLAGVVLLMLLIPAAGGNALRRWLIPWRAYERYTFAQLAGGADLQVVPYAEPFEVEARLKADSPWKPASAWARYQEQTPIVATRDGETYRFSLPPQITDGKVSVRVGDARRSISVEPKLRPALNALWVQVQLPPYLQLSEPLKEDARGGTLSLVKGSIAVFAATATRDLAAAALDGRAQAVDGPQVTTEPMTVEASTDLRLTWRDQFGLSAREAQVLRIEALDDQGPTVNFNKLKNQQVVLSHEVLSFEIQARDDFGVKRVGLDWQGIQDPIHNPEPSQGEKIVAAGAPSHETVDVPATFCADREGVHAQTLRLRAFAEDYLPARERVYSSSLVLHVLTSAEHFRWLTDQMSQWADAAREVYDEERQLHVINKELRDLPPEALDDPAQRKQIQHQAAAESANADQLNALVSMGKELVQEAAQNEEFDAHQLDAWAEMLKQLEAIAGEQMPSVAELLQQAAEAPGQPTPSPAEPPLPGEPGAAKPKKGSDNKGPEDPLAAPPGAMPANPTPLVNDTESGFNQSEKAGETPPIKGGLLIPGTTLAGGGKDDGDEEDGEEPEATTADLVLQAVTEQQDLLDAFAKLAQEMNTLLMGFENSTFVKRLKAASRMQIDLALELNNLGGFGLDDPALDNQAQRRLLAERETTASDTVLLIQEDMDAYAERKPSPNYTRVLAEMQETTVIAQIRDLAAAINRNAVGQSTIEAEYWADTLDRWAEQLVDPMGDSEPAPTELVELPNLTPEIILEVLRIINGEIELREETRELDQAIGAIDQEIYARRGAELSVTQAELATKSRELVEQIRAMPNAPDHADETLAREIEALFDKGEFAGEALARRIEWLTGRAELGKEVLQGQIDKLTKAATVMDEVEALLAQPATGSPTIAAIVEVIEILHETQRLPNAPMIVKAPPATASALMLMGLGDDDSRAFIENRAPGQATGKAGRKLPEEFRAGLDAYFDALEGKRFD
jgi:hypothetical protein